VNPQGNRKFGIDITRLLGPYIQIKAILTEGSLITVTPLCIVATSELDVLITGMLKTVAKLNALPGNYGLRSLPTVLTNRRSCIRNAAEYEYVLYAIYGNTLYLTALNAQYRTEFLLAALATGHKSQNAGKKQKFLHNDCCIGLR
jgi:hypothetical protein